MSSRPQPLRYVTHWTALLLAVAVCLSTKPAPIRASATSAPEYEVKAAFLLNFTKFVEWPAAAFREQSAPFTICVFGNDPFGKTLDNITSGESVAGRRLVVSRVSQPPAPQTCQMLFLPAATPEPAKVLASLGPGVLTVGEGEPFLQSGGMIAFLIDNHRVRFDISQSVAEAAGLKVSSKLLSVARMVRK